MDRWLIQMNFQRQTGIVYANFTCFFFSGNAKGEHVLRLIAALATFLLFQWPWLEVETLFKLVTGNLIRIGSFYPEIPEDSITTTLNLTSSITKKIFRNKTTTLKRLLRLQRSLKIICSFWEHCTTSVVLVH